jgi:CRISPR-associated protein Csx3
MTSFVINKKSDDLIEVQIDKLASGDQVVRDAKARLDEMINGGELAGGKLLKIYGPMSIPVTYVMAHYLAHLYGAIALSDTRLGAYVVVSSTTPDYPFASRISFETGEVTEVPPDRSNSPAISINYEQGILRTKINGNVQKDGEQLVLETEARLEELINTKQLQGGKTPLLINGRFSILAS